MTRSSPSCYDKAVALLARRPHFRRQLQEKLVARGFPQEEIERTLERLAREGYLDDRRAARDFVAARLERGGVGRRRLWVELQRRGAPPELVEEVLDELVPEDDLEAARVAAERWRRRGGEDPAALARHLHRQGFSRRAIFLMVQELPGSGEE